MAEKSNESSSQGKASWAKVLSKSLPTSWKKNVLEILLEKDEKGSFNVSQEDCARLMMKIGIDPRCSTQVEEVQICPNGRGRIFVTLRKDVIIDQFCRYDIIEVTQSGIRAVNIKPVNKREVVICMKNIHPNTKDDTVITYLNKYGKVLTSKVVYGIYAEGPLKGLRNGDRSFKMELNPNTNLGSYHVLDGQRVTARYSGQIQTCARCLQSARTCKGNGLAKKCEEEQGVKADFAEYILSLWEEIGYKPEIDHQIEPEDDDEDEAVTQQDGGVFTPAKQLASQKH